MKACKLMTTAQSVDNTVLTTAQISQILGGTGTTTGTTGSGSSASSEPYQGSTDEEGPGEID